MLKPTQLTDVTLPPRPNPSTGRFGFARGADGDVSFDGTGAHAVVTAALEKKGAWWADPSHGSDLHKLTSLERSTPSQAAATVRESQGPLLRDGTVATVGVEAVVVPKLGRLSVDVTWSPPGGAEQARTVG